MKKELLIAAKFDTTDFDKSVDQMQRKLKDIYAPSDHIRMQAQTQQRLAGQGMGGIMSTPTMDSYAKTSQQSRRELDQVIREQAQGQEKITKVVSQREQTLKKLQQIQKDLVKGSQEELRVKELIARVEENNFKKREEYRQRDSMLNQLMDIKEKSKPQGIDRLMQAYRGGGVGGAGRAGLRMLQGMDMGGLMGGAGSAVALGAQVGQVGSDIYRYLGRAPIEASAAMGRATQGTLGKELESAYAGRSPLEMAFLPEKARAARMAMEATRRVGNTQFSDVGLGLLKSGGIGAAAGALGGSFIPGLGTAAGAVVGGIGGLAKGAMGALGDPMQRATLLSPFSQEADKHRQAMLAQTFADNFQQALEGEKLQNPLKRMAAEEYQQTFMRNLQFQRQLGLGNEGLKGPGGFMEKAINSGFTPEMAMEMSQGVMSAGGSTRMGRDSAFGLKAARGADLTNASQVLGTLSGGLGNAEASKQATIKILAEGMKLGLDDSEFAEENRKFVQTTAEIVSRSGARSETDIDKVIGGFSRFMAEPTTKGMEAARGAYDKYQQLSTSTSGPQGVMRAAGFLRDEKLGSLSAIDKMALSSIPAEQLTEDHPVVQDLARRYNIPPNDIVQRRTKIDQSSINRLGRADVLTESIKRQKKDMGMTGPESEFMGPLPEQFVRERGELNTVVGAEYPDLLKDRRQLESFTGAMTSGDTDKMRKMREDVEKGKIEGAGTRDEDKTIAGLAESSRLALENFRQFKDQIVVSADAVGKFNQRLKETVEIIGKMPEDQRAGMFSKLTGALFGAGEAPKNQPQAGKAGK